MNDYDRIHSSQDSFSVKNLDESLRLNSDEESQDILDRNVWKNRKKTTKKNDNKIISLKIPKSTKGKKTKKKSSKQ